MTFILDNIFALLTAIPFFAILIYGLIVAHENSEPVDPMTPYDRDNFTTNKSKE